MTLYILLALIGAATGALTGMTGASGMSILVSGGGMPMGQVIGATNSRGEHPADRPLDPNDFLATVYRFLGIDPAQNLHDQRGRPIPILPHGDPISELL